jgi:hypothetical protein
MKSDVTFELIELVEAGFVEDFVNQMYAKHRIMQQVLESNSSPAVADDAEKFRQILIEFGEALLQQTAVQFTDTTDIN